MEEVISEAQESETLKDAGVCWKCIFAGSFYGDGCEAKWDAYLQRKGRHRFRAMPPSSEDAEPTIMIEHAGCWCQKPKETNA